MKFPPAATYRSRIANDVASSVNGAVKNATTAIAGGINSATSAATNAVSAATGKGVERILPTLEKVAAERRKRIPTAEMNRFLKDVDFERASVPARQQVKIYYMTQAGASPPTFVLFTNRKVKLHFSYQRFLENQLRKAFGFVGSPIWIKNRARG